MVDTNDGFKIAEVDLKLRGPGDLMGTQQSGVLNLRIADIVKDTPILQKARSMAFSVLHKDRNLQLPGNKNILDSYSEISRNKSMWARIS